MQYLNYITENTFQNYKYIMCLLTVIHTGWKGKVCKVRVLKVHLKIVFLLVSSATKLCKKWICIGFLQRQLNWFECYTIWEIFESVSQPMRDAWCYFLVFHASEINSKLKNVIVYVVFVKIFRQVINTWLL